MIDTKTPIRSRPAVQARRRGYAPAHPGGRARSLRGPGLRGRQHPPDRRGRRREPAGHPVLLRQQGRPLPGDHPRHHRRHRPPHEPGAGERVQAALDAPDTSREELTALLCEMVETFVVPGDQRHAGREPPPHLRPRRGRGDARPRHPARKRHAADLQSLPRPGEPPARQAHDRPGDDRAHPGAGRPGRHLLQQPQAPRPCRHTASIAERASYASSWCASTQTPSAAPPLPPPPEVVSAEVLSMRMRSPFLRRLHDRPSRRLQLRSRFRAACQAIDHRYTPEVAGAAHQRGRQRPGGAAQTFVPAMDIPGEWWTLFHSPQLDTLVREALRANPDIDAAQAALRQARENFYAQQGSLFPTITGKWPGPRSSSPRRLPRARRGTAASCTASPRPRSTSPTRLMCSAVCAARSNRRRRWPRCSASSSRRRTSAHLQRRRRGDQPRLAAGADQRHPGHHPHPRELARRWCAASSTWAAPRAPTCWRRKRR